MGPYSFRMMLTIDLPGGLFRACALSALLLALLAAPALAAAPVNPYPLSPGERAGMRVTATMAQTITLPYTFEVIDFSGADVPDLPAIDFSSVATINLIGSIAVTIMSLLDQYAFLGIFVLILAGLGVIWWLYSIVTGKSNTVTLNASGGISAAAGLYSDVQNYQLQQEVDMIESRDFSDNESLGRLAGPTVALNKSLMAGNRQKATSWRKIGKLTKSASRLRW